MSLAVVRCPACGGASRVPLDALGQMVGCPRCQSPFVAAEDAPEAPLPSRTTNAPPRRHPQPVRGRVPRPAAEPRLAAEPRPAAVIPIAPPRRPRPEPVPGSAASVGDPVEPADPEHDPHTPIPGGVPFSVLVGFALMPFGIPLLWFIGPLLSGFEAALSLAVPVSLAVAAAALCLGIVYTIDWAAATRIKGVLMLVCLAYLTAAGLYFLKKDLMDRVQGFFGRPGGWVDVSPPDSKCRVRMPEGEIEKVKQQPLPGIEFTEGRRGTHKVATADGERTYSYFVAASAPRAVPAADDRWFGEIGSRLKEGAGDPAPQETRILYNDEHPGRQWELKVGAGGGVRIVRVFVIHGRVYYLSAEGPDLAEERAALAEPFFRSFASFQTKK